MAKDAAFDRSVTFNDLVVIRGVINKDGKTKLTIFDEERGGRNCDDVHAIGELYNMLRELLGKAEDGSPHRVNRPINMGECKRCGNPFAWLVANDRWLPTALDTVDQGERVFVEGKHRRHSCGDVREAMDLSVRANAGKGGQLELKGPDFALKDLDFPKAMVFALASGGITHASHLLKTTEADLKRIKGFRINWYHLVKSYLAEHQKEINCDE
jgi:hypothetical protein